MKHQRAPTNKCVCCFIGTGWPGWETGMAKTFHAVDRSGTARPGGLPLGSFSRQYWQFRTASCVQAGGGKPKQR